MPKPIDNIPKIRKSLTFYRWMAYIAGSFLLLLVVEMVLKYSPTHVEVYLGDPRGFFFLAPVMPEPMCQWYSLFVPGGMGCEIISTGEGFNLSLFILIAHGWIYVAYLLACFLLWQAMRWPVRRLVIMALGGVVPFLSFFTEASMHRIAVAEIDVLERKKVVLDRKRAERKAEKAAAAESAATEPADQA